jgi:integrase
MSFQQAQDRAAAWLEGIEAKRLGKVSSSLQTVADSAQDWLDHFEGSERSKATSEANVTHYILPTLGRIEVRNLTRKDVESWLHKTAKSKPLKVQRREAATKKLAPSRQSKIVYDASDPETIRKRRDTANRIFNDLRALLNRAADNDTALNRNVWESVDKFQNVARASDSYLSVDEVPRFTKACDDDFKTLVQAAVVTGCRYDELCRLRVSAFDPNTATISLVQQKTGKMKRIFLTEDETAFIANLCDGKEASDFLLLRSDEQPWGKSHQQDRMKAALGKAGIKRHIRFHDLRHTFASLLMQQGVALEVVSNQLGHSSTAITSKHYAHLSPEYIGRSVRDNKPSFGLSAVA